MTDGIEIRGALHTREIFCCAVTLKIRGALLENIDDADICLREATDNGSILQGGVLKFSI